MRAMKDVDPRIAAIFKRGSKTYFNSSIFFPQSVRHDVFYLYAFVRTADDFVDAQPQDANGFRGFRAQYERALASGTASGNLVIDSFLELAQNRGFDPAWTRAFLDSMEADLRKSHYDSLEETLAYIYGSAEVIGLYMAAILGLPPESFPAARALGRSMQFINFIRDIDEDNRLGRIYLPLAGSGLSDLHERTAAEHAEQFRSFMRAQAERYLVWQAEAEAGFRYIPKRSRIAIMTASRLYNWTARVIQRDPFVVFRRKVKPTKFHILVEALKNGLAVGLGRY